MMDMISLYHWYLSLMDITIRKLSD
uniref:Uncharacterized protein n=1 Tax=Arundo donax TaxID=35708 RepID=A0A0A9B4H6_ARUDO